MTEPVDRRGPGTERRSNTRGGRRATDVTFKVKETLAAIEEITRRVPLHIQSARIHVSVSALLETHQPDEMREELKRLWREVDQALAEDPLLQLEAMIVRLRRQLGE
jgi:hypothetical protein